MVLGKKDKQKVAALEQQVKALEARLVSKDVDVQQLTKTLDEEKEKVDGLRELRQFDIEKLLRLRRAATELMESI